MTKTLKIQMINSLKKHWMKPDFQGFMFIAALLLAIAPWTQGAAQPEGGGIVKTGSLVPQKLAVVLNPGDLNFLKAPLAEYTASLRESSARGMWVQGWNTPEQFFRWTMTAPAAGSYVVDALVSGEPGATIEIIGPLNRLELTLPPGNDHWGNNWNRLRVPGALSLPAGESIITVRSPAPKGAATAKLNGMALVSLELATRHDPRGLGQARAGVPFEHEVVLGCEVWRLSTVGRVGLPGARPKEEMAAND